MLQFYKIIHAKSQFVLTLLLQPEQLWEKKKCEVDVAVQKMADNKTWLSLTERLHYIEASQYIEWRGLYNFSVLE